MKIKSVFLSLKVLIYFVLLRTFGSIIHDISRKHEDVSVSQLRRYEQLRVKINKLQLDIQFLENCQLFQVTPNFITHNVRGIHENDVGLLQKHALTAELRRHGKRKQKLELELAKVSKHLGERLSGFDFLVLQRAVSKNVTKNETRCINVHEKKLRNLTKNHYLPFKHQDVVTNRSTYTCTDEENELLKYGLQHAVPPRFLRKSDVLTSFDTIHRVMKKDLKCESKSIDLKSQISLLASTYTGQYKVSQKTLEKHRILKRLQKNKDIVITKPDKGNGVVILDRAEYLKMVYEVVNDSSKFKKLDGDKTVTRETKLQKFLLKLKKKGFFNEIDYTKVYPTGSSVARIYGLPKMHKLKSAVDKLKVRPIVSCIKAYNYGLSSYLAKMVNPLIPKDFCADDTFSFIQDVRNIDTHDCFMVSYDVTSLFTNIPLDETIQLAVDLVFESQPNIKISKSELKDLFEFATRESHFLFDGNFYDQIDGVAMGSPLGPVLANLFMAVNEKRWLESCEIPPSFYRRYVDDIFCLMKSEDDANNFLVYLNGKHPNIKFTMEIEEDKKLPFLDVLITSNNGSFETSVYRKMTFTGLFMNYRSFLPKTYKIGLISTLIDRIYKISQNREIFNFEFKKVKEYLGRNAYPPHLVDKQLSRYLRKVESSQDESNVNEKNTSYVKLPYIGEYSKRVQRKIFSLCSEFCKNTDIKVVFTSEKISSYFSTKDILPSALRSGVVYKFKCAGCNACYVGQTTRHFDTRVHEHLYKKSQPSSVYKHLDQNPRCRQACDETCFSILDRDVSSFRLEVKETIHNEWIQPTINKQRKLLKLSILI